MSMTAGDIGSKSVFPDGIQVDHISENTVGHGARPKPITDPTTYPVGTGEIGEKLTASLSNTTISSSGVDTVVGSLALTAGIWMVYSKVAVGPAGSSVSGVDFCTSLTTAIDTPYVVRDLTTGTTGTRYLGGAPRYISTAGVTVNMIVNYTYTGTAPATIAANSFLYAVRIA